MIDVTQKNVKELYVVISKSCPIWRDFSKLWNQLKAKYESDSVKFYTVDVALPEGKEFAQSRFVSQSPTIISNEGFRLTWKPEYTEETFKDKFLKQENVFDSGGF